MKFLNFTKNPTFSHFSRFSVFRGQLTHVLGWSTNHRSPDGSHTARGRRRGAVCCVNSAVRRASPPPTPTYSLHFHSHPFHWNKLIRTAMIPALGQDLEGHDRSGHKRGWMSFKIKKGTFIMRPAQKPRQCIPFERILSKHVHLSGSIHCAGSCAERIID